MESLPATARPDAPAPPARTRADIHDSPWVTLAYLLFVFLPMLFGARGWQQALVASLVAVALFLPLHFHFYRAAPARRPLLVLAVAAIGWATIPFKGKVPCAAGRMGCSGNRAFMNPSSRPR